MKTGSLNNTVALLLFAGAMSLGHSDGIQLRYAFQEGKVYKYRTTIDFFNDVSAGGGVNSVKPFGEISLGVSLSVFHNSSMRDQTWKYVVDTVGMRVASPGDSQAGRAPRVLTFDRLKGKSVVLVVDDRGVPKSARADDPSVLNQTRELGFELFSRDLLNVTLIFPEFPENSLVMNQPWRFSRADTVSRGGQQIVVTRVTECKVVGQATVGIQMCHKIAYMVSTRIRGEAVNGETTATGTFYCSERGIPIQSEASINFRLSAGGTETIQKRTVKAILE